MFEPTTFRAVIELWASRKAMALDLCAIGAGEGEASSLAEVSSLAAAVTKWSQRDNIPSEWWSVVLATEVAKSKGLTAETFTKLAARNLAEART